MPFTKKLPTFLVIVGLCYLLMFYLPSHELFANYVCVYILNAKLGYRQLAPPTALSLLRDGQGCI
jgi:hypothetical protein